MDGPSLAFSDAAIQALGHASAYNSDDHVTAQRCNGGL